MVPHLLTALTGPINELEQRILDSMPSIERWFRLEWMEHTPLFYSAVDVRNAGFKLAPVGTDLFPCGWHNLTPAMLPLAVQAAMAAIEKICPEARNLLIIPDKQTSDDAYVRNLLQLRRIFHMAGLHVRMGSISPELKESKVIELTDGDRITLEPVVRARGRLGVQDFDPCTILLNNDLRAGAPGILEDIHEQFLLPPLHAGTATRRKSTHFKCYEEISKRFGKLIGVDSWLINPMFDKIQDVHPGEGAGLEALRSGADAMLGKIKKRYKEYGIKEKPFVVIRSDIGGRGIGAAAVYDAREIDANTLGTRPGNGEPGDASPDVMVQEGVLTQERVNEALAEPVVYMMDRYVVGGFYRVQDSPDVPLAFAESMHLPQLGQRPGASAPNRFYMYGVIARLAMLAASYELEATDPENEF